jgi:histidyl-tRNA synthetase
MKKQLNYANSRKIPFVALVGEQELEQGLITLKEMESGKQEQLTPDQLLKKLGSV